MDGSRAGNAVGIRDGFDDEVGIKECTFVWLEVGILVGDNEEILEGLDEIEGRTDLNSVGYKDGIMEGSIDGFDEKDGERLRSLVGFEEEIVEGCGEWIIDGFGVFKSVTLCASNVADVDGIEATTAATTIIETTAMDVLT